METQNAHSVWKSTLQPLAAVAGLGVASLLITEGESSAELDRGSLPPLIIEG